MENTKENSPIGKACDEEKTKKSNKEEEEEEEKNVHAEIQKEDQLKSAKAKVGEIREENEKLKLLLARIMKDYQSLQMHFSNILYQEEAKRSPDQKNEETELVSLSLGRASSVAKKDKKKISNNLSRGNEDAKFKEGLTLGLDCRFQLNSTEGEKNPSSENNFEELKEAERTEMWPPSKILKTMRSEDEEVLQHTNLKKPRVSVRARCDTATMNDGCQWRKYGQKIAKRNPCPRAYYRCTVLPTCPVRKQVQRWSEDMSILITTYEGTHNHPLPISATAMASTTSTAASMLQCRSSISQPGLGTSVSATNGTSTDANLHGLNITFSENAKPHQLYFPNSSISTSNSHPTIILDLTEPAAFSHFNRPFSAPRYNSPTSLNFSSPSSKNSFEPKTLHTSWGNEYSSYGTLNAYNKSIHAEALNFGGQPQPQEHIFQPYMQMNNLTPPPPQYLTETIAATTKVITSNPNFQSALAAAISSYISNGGCKAQQNQGEGENSGFNSKWGESFPKKPADSSSAQNGIGRGSSF